MILYHVVLSPPQRLREGRIQTGFTSLPLIFDHYGDRELGPDMNRKHAVIIGAGPAGLTAAYELLDKTDIKPIIFEKSNDIGGLSKTVNYKGNRIDLGGHRFFSKSDRVMEWWKKIMPVQGSPARDDLVLGRTTALSPAPDAPDPEKADKVFLVRNRLSRIFFRGKLFDYPVSLSRGTLTNFGLLKVAGISRITQKEDPDSARAKWRRILAYLSAGAVAESLMRVQEVNQRHTD